MASPPEVKLSDLSGEWVMNKTLSDDVDPVLALQGISWMTRKAISWATVTLHVKQYIDEAGLTHIDIANTATGGIKGTTELRTLDFVQRKHEDSMFGSMEGKSRWISIGSPEAQEVDSWLLEGWLEEGEESGPNGETKIHSIVKSTDKGWGTEQVWGFAIVDGKRYYTRRLTTKKGDKTIRIRLVYDKK